VIRKWFEGSTEPTQDLSDKRIATALRHSTSPRTMSSTSYRRTVKGGGHWMEVGEPVREPSAKAGVRGGDELVAYAEGRWISCSQRRR
jgi:hypothetical protein